MLIDDVILTPRHEQVLRGVAARKTLKEIAGDLGISESRVNDHVRKLKSLFAANSLSQLAQVQADRSGADAPYRFSHPQILVSHQGPDPLTTQIRTKRGGIRRCHSTMRARSGRHLCRGPDWTSRASSQGCSTGPISAGRAPKRWL